MPSAPVIDRAGDLSNRMTRSNPERAAPARQPNPEAIAWYVEQAEDLLDDLNDRIQSLRTRGGQLAGFSGGVIALVGANAGSMLGAVHGAARIAVGISLLAGTFVLVIAFAIALRGTLVPNVVSGASAQEVANYATERFTHEPDLWRVHVRMLNGLLASMAMTTTQGDRAADAVRWAVRLFLAGLLAVAAALVILVAVVTF